MGAGKAVPLKERDTAGLVNYLEGLGADNDTLNAIAARKVNGRTRGEPTGWGKSCGKRGFWRQLGG